LSAASSLRLPCVRKRPRRVIFGCHDTGLILRHAPPGRRQEAASLFFETHRLHGIPFVPARPRPRRTLTQDRTLATARRRGPSVVQRRSRWRPLPRRHVARGGVWGGLLLRCWHLLRQHPWCFRTLPLGAVKRLPPSRGASAVAFWRVPHLLRAPSWPLGATSTRAAGRGARLEHAKSGGTRSRPRVAVGGFRGWKGRGLSAVDSTPPGAAPKYPDPGQQGNDLSKSQGDRIWSGAGFFPRGFPNPPTTCLNFSLWRHLSVWRIWGGYFSRWRSGWGGVY